MNITFEEYARRNYPDVFAEYIRYLKREQLPKVGDRVFTLRSGFGGYAGVVRRVKEFRSTYIVLTDGERDYLSDIESWWKDLEVIG